MRLRVENVEWKIESGEWRVEGWQIHFVAAFGGADYELQITDYALASRLPSAVGS